MYKLKLFAQRTVALGAVATLVTASLPPIQALAYNELNPLTERSLLLSSSAPGYVDTDGSGNSTDSPNPTGAAYAPAGSGANGKKTGQTFSFRVSTDSNTTDRPIRALSFQYCTSAAGVCQAPGNNEGDARIATGEGAREANDAAHPNSRSDLNVNYTSAEGGTDFKIFTEDEEGEDLEITDYTGWTLEAANREDEAHTGALTGKNNFIVLKHDGEGISPAFNERVKVVFIASETNYITNPGGGSFFVKINTFDDSTADIDGDGTYLSTSPSRIDGGVTVANMMTDSIHITTKVLETMQFSVGIALPEQAETGPFSPCAPIIAINNNRIDLGNPNAENSLETDRAHEQKSYWRIQSNSSGGATVYYSGDTLRNTVGDEIQPMSVTKAPAKIGNQPNYTAYGDPEMAVSNPSSEQFGLALVQATSDVSAAYNLAKNGNPDAVPTPTAPDNRLGDLTLNPLTTDDSVYDTATGEGNAKTYPGEDNGEWLDAPSGTETTNFAQFGFTPRSVVTPEPLASGNSVLSCTTGKMRYVGNIAADTPAGVYTTKINYLAAPKY